MEVFSMMSVMIGGALLVLAIVASVVNPFVRPLRFPARKEARKEEGSEEDDAVTDVNEKQQTGGGKEPVTVLLTAHDSLVELQRNLPEFLSQKYAPGYQVVVVCQSTDGETIDYLTRMRAQNPHLYFTYIPERSRYMSRKKLQITLGVKAAQHEWVVLTEPSCRPQSEGWLEAMASQCAATNSLVLGYVALDGETKGVRRFENIRKAYYLLRRAQRKRGYRTHMPCVAFRKSDFMRMQGFQGNLELVRGEYDFLVNKYASCGDTAVELSREAWLVQDEQTDKEWHNKSLYLHASRKLLEGAPSMRTLMFFDHLLPHLSMIASVAALAYSVLRKDWILLGCAVASLLLLFVLRLCIARRAVRRFDDTICAFLLVFYEYGIVWRNLADSWRYWRADKNDFTSHKL